jgi:hypothetical protein
MLASGLGYDHLPWEMVPHLIFRWGSAELLVSLSLILERLTTPEPSTTKPLLGGTDGVTLAESQRGVLMSDCLHCDIHEMLESHLQSEQADLAEIAAKVTEVLADLILLAPPDEQAMLLAAVVANVGGMVLEKSQEDDPNSPRRSSH